MAPCPGSDVNPPRAVLNQFTQTCDCTAYHTNLDTYDFSVTTTPSAGAFAYDFSTNEWQGDCASQYRVFTTADLDSSNANYNTVAAVVGASDADFCTAASVETVDIAGVAVRLTINPASCCDRLECEVGYSQLDDGNNPSTLVQRNGAPAPFCEAADGAGQTVKISGCIEKTCAPYDLDSKPGLVGQSKAPPKPCWHGKVLSTTDDYCDVQCDDGYEAWQGSVRCLATAGNAPNNPVDVTHTCVPNSCAAYVFGLGVTGDSSSGNNACVNMQTLKTRSGLARFVQPGAGLDWDTHVPDPNAAHYDKACQVKCADGYEYGTGNQRKSATVLCPDTAVLNYGEHDQSLLVPQDLKQNVPSAETGDLHCVPSGCAVDGLAVVGRDKSDGCDGRSTADTLVRGAYPTKNLVAFRCALLPPVLVKQDLCTPFPLLLVTALKGHGVQVDL